MFKVKKVFVIVFSVVLIISMSISAFATAVVWDSINVNLPKYSMNTEFREVDKSDQTIGYFTIKIDSISGGYTAIRAWTEKPLGGNYSDSSKIVSVSSNGSLQENVNYTQIPSNGAGVILNLDNPIYTTTQPKVMGSWTPN